MDRISHVLKSAVVRPAGSCLIGGQAGHGRPGQDQGGAATAKIVEQGDGTAVVEVTCACGRRTRVNCTYARAEQ